MSAPAPAGAPAVPPPFGRRRAEVAEATRAGAYRVLAVADPEGPPPRPGQFYMLAATDRWGAGNDERPFLPRAFSFLRAEPDPCFPPPATRLLFLLDRVGPGTARLQELGPGDGLWLTGPLGLGWTAPEDGRRAILCAGGVGVPPLCSWHDELRGRGVPCAVVAGFRDAAHAEAAALLGDAQVATDDGSAGHHGLVTDLLAAELDADPRAAVYACGPPGMLEAVRALAGERGVPAQLALESGMACGFGACFGCVVALRGGGYARVCVDGPVFDAAALQPGAIH